MLRRPYRPADAALGLLVAACVLVETRSARYSPPKSDSTVTETKDEKTTDAARVHVELGQSYMEQGKLDFAMENLNKALDRDPNYVDAHTVIGVLYERIGNRKAAEEHYAKAAQLAPKSGDVNNNYGQFLCAARQICAGAAIFHRRDGRSVLQDAGRRLQQRRQLPDERRQRPSRRSPRLISARRSKPIRRSGVALFGMADALYQKERLFPRPGVHPALRGAGPARSRRAFAGAQHRSETRPSGRRARLRATPARTVPRFRAGSRPRQGDIINHGVTLRSWARKTTTKIRYTPRGTGISHTQTHPARRRRMQPSRSNFPYLTP